MVCNVYNSLSIRQKPNRKGKVLGTVPMNKVVNIVGKNMCGIKTSHM